MERVVSGFLRVTVVSGLYGFTRGFRAEHPTHKNLIGYRCVNGILNSFLYINPIFSVFYFGRVFNRLEIHMSGLNPDDYLREYEEIGGYCMAIL